MEKFVLPCEADQPIRDAVEYAWRIQEHDGHWVGDVGMYPVITAEYVFLHQSLGDIDSIDRKALIKWLLSQQKSDGSWTIAPDLPGNVSMTVEVYLALKLLGVAPTEPTLQRARLFVLSAGGVEMIRIHSRIYLAMFGLWPWNMLPQLPVELIFMPRWAPINIYRFSSWARSFIVPLMILCHHRPIYALPNGLSASNSFLDELWCNPDDKNVPCSKPLRELLRDDYLGSLFAIIDTSLLYTNCLRWAVGIRHLARKRCLQWIVEHQEPEGDWAGYFPPVHLGILALNLEGIPLSDKRIQKALEAIERFACKYEDGSKKIQACVSPVWDTVLMSAALSDGGVPGDDQRHTIAIEWVKARQILATTGDWRVYSKCKISGGFCFEYFNAEFPDVDDTAAAVLAFLKQDPSSVGSKCLIDAATWMVGMQNNDGGWAAFDVNNDNSFLNRIPFSDMDALCDPSTADVTARVLEALGLLMDTASLRHACLYAEVLPAIETGSHRAIQFLAKEQEQSGAWFGRWGCNYIYGTSGVLCALAAWPSNSLAQSLAPAALDWLKSVQNEDGGFGESLESYDCPELAGRGRHSVSSQTAWGVLGLLAYLPPTDSGIQRAIKWLLNNMQDGQNGGKTWTEDEYTATGFPGHIYMKYALYPHYFPLMALGRYNKAMKLLK